MSYFAPSIGVLTVTFGVIGGIGNGFVFLTSILACGVYFRKRRALANGLAMCGSGVGVFILSPVLELLLTRYDWDGTVLLLSGFALNGCIFASLYRPLPLVRYQEEAVVSIPDSGDSGIEPAESVNDENSVMDENDNASSLNIPQVSTPRPRTNSIGVQYRHLLLLKRETDHNSASHLPLPFVSSSKLRVSSSTIYRSGYWENSAPLSHVDLCQIGSMLTIPTVYSGFTGPTGGVIHSRSLMTIEEEKNWREKIKFGFVEVFRSIYKIFSLHLLGNPIMWLLIIASTLWTGQASTYTYLVDYAGSRGISRSKGAFLLSTIGITNCIGRILVGVATDSPRVNSTLVYIVSIAAAGFVNIIIPFVEDFELLMTLATIYGLCMASYVSLRSIVVVDLMGVDNLAGALGLVVMFQGIGFTIAPPISGAIYEVYENYLVPFLACGACYILSAIVMLPVLFYLRKLAKKQVDTISSV